MADIPIPPKWKQLWDTWDLRAFILLSLSLQTFLILFAPLRKRTSSNWLIMPLWFAYLLADWTANFAIGLISNSQGKPGAGSCHRGGGVGAEDNEDLLAFWAPFLLVHLGGPDTITAFALEDNELWLRHLLGLVVQCLAAVYVFIQSLPHNRLWIPTMLMFISGIIKYTERTRALYLASADRFKDSMRTDPDPGPNYAKFMDEYFSKKEARLPTRVGIIPEPDKVMISANEAKKGNLTELEVVQYAYQFFEMFKGLFVDLTFSQGEWNQSRDFFLNRTAKDAFKVVEVELNFIYEVLFTKLPVVYGYLGVVSRFFSFATVSSAIVIFAFKKKTKYTDTDVIITYGLLFGALVLDVIALLMLLFSDWNIISLRMSPDDEPDKKSFRTRILGSFLKLMTEGTLQAPQNEARPRQQKTEPPKSRSVTWIMKRRWSESISTFNVIYYCLHRRSGVERLIYDNLGLSRFLNDIKYVKVENFTEKLQDFIFEELKSKSEFADDMEKVKKISSSRGDWVLHVEKGWSGLLPYTLDVSYDHSLLLWHIATELCYNHELNHELHQMKYVNPNEDLRKISKILSGYMLYLLIMRPSMMSELVAVGQVRFMGLFDTYAEGMRFFENKKGRKVNEVQKADDREVDWEQINACKEILDVHTEVIPVNVKGDRSKSLLFDGCILAEELMKIEEKDKSLNKWSIVSKVWLELLCYAASHCKGNTQAQQVSKGGELITIVWLLMAHFGLGGHFQINQARGRAKLILG